MINRKNTKKESIDVCNVVKDYTGEFPCFTCNNSIKVANKRNNKPYDLTIISLLLKNYVTQIYGKKMRGLASERVSRIPTRRKDSYIPQKKIYTTVEKYIIKISFSKTDKKSYKFKRTINGIVYRKQYKTLKEAQKYKKEIEDGLSKIKR